MDPRENMFNDLTDKQEIYEVICSYCRCVDRLDTEGVRDLYHPDGIDNHTGFSGPVNDWVEYLAGVLPRYDGTQHVIGNHLVELHGDVAISETYGTANHWGTPAATRP